MDHENRACQVLLNTGMSYGKEIGQILAEEVLELVLTEELELMEIRDLDTLGVHITKTEAKLGKSHAKTKALKRLYKRKSGIEGIRNFKPADEMDEAELQEIRGLNRLNMALNKTLLSQDPEDRQHAMRLQALKRRKMMLGFEESESAGPQESDVKNAAKEFLNSARNTKLGHPKHKDTYALASSLTKAGDNWEDHHWDGVKTALNMVPRKKLNNPHFSDSYKLAAHLDKNKK